MLFSNLEIMLLDMPKFLENSETESNWSFRNKINRSENKVSELLIK